MTHDFWLERWQKNEIGFHQEDYNPYLTQFCSELSLEPGSTVFVPLCGKSLDMLWLRQQGYRVIGVELAEKACVAFFTENNLPYETRQYGGFTVYEVDGITIYQGDFFKVTEDMLAEVSGMFDRGAMVAMPPEMRSSYTSHLRKVLPANAPVLLVSFEYAEEEMTGPPYMVTQQELEAHYADRFEPLLLLRKDVLAENPHFKERGLSQLHELTYLLKPK